MFQDACHFFNHLIYIVFIQDSMANVQTFQNKKCHTAPNPAAIGQINVQFRVYIFRIIDLLNNAYVS